MRKETTYNAYKAHGNITAMPHFPTMEWDYADQLHKAISGTSTAFYNYDVGGNRIRKVVEKQDGTKEVRIYIGKFEIYRKFDSNEDLVTERKTVFVTDGDKRIATIDTLTVDNKVAVGTLADIIRYQIDNHLGSASLELDENAEIISYEEYHPFGTSSYRLHTNSTEVSRKRYRYVGKERDEETGLFYYGARYFCAWIARFISTDPLNDDYPELSSYQYASNRPIIAIDLDGLEAFIVNQNDSTINIRANVFFVGKGKGKVYPNELKPEVEKQFTNNQLGKEERTVVGSEVKFSMNYISADKDGNPLDYKTAQELAKQSTIKYTDPTTQKEHEIKSWRTAVVVVSDSYKKGEKLPSETLGQFIPGEINEDGKFNLIKLKDATKAWDQNPIIKRFIHELGHFMGMKTTGENSEKATHPQPFQTDPGITSKKDKNIRLTPLDIPKMVRGANYFGERLIIDNEK